MRLDYIYRVAAVYDTETSNIRVKEDNGNGCTEYQKQAYPILFILNKLNEDLRYYEIGKSDNIELFRYEKDMINAIGDIIEEYRSRFEVPIICAYNLIFDVQPIMRHLSERYEIIYAGQSSTSAYYIDLLDKETKDKLMRFWDVSYLEPRGLAAMGKTCGLPKDDGWDYAKTRTPETPITEEEEEYAKRDVQVIPAYLKFLLEANSFIRESDFGNALMTKTSLIRLFGRRVTGRLEYEDNNGKTKKIIDNMIVTCKVEQAKTYKQYAWRRASFRGGLAFTAANYAGDVLEDVLSLDACSMYHAFINGRYVPYNFGITVPAVLKNAMDNIKNVSIEEALNLYFKPFNFAFHAKVRFYNIRLKEDSIFGKHGIATIAKSKFDPNGGGLEYEDDILRQAAETAVRESGYYDRAYKAQFAFSKLMKAEICELYLNEVEFWIICQVYDFDEYEAIEGEISRNFWAPDSYVSLMSNYLYETKKQVKKLMKEYKEGESFLGSIGGSIPAAIQDEAREGTLSKEWLESYYTDIVKGQYNAIYGSQAQDERKPQFRFKENGEVEVDKNSKASPNNFIKIDKSMVHYQFGERIAAGARMHMIIAMMLLYKRFGNKIIISGGDTDSLKISAANISNKSILKALKPLHEAIDKAINICQKRYIRKYFADYASSLDNVGHFEVENDSRYIYHMEAWNKARISITEDYEAEITLSGMPQPAGAYNIADAANDFLDAGYDPKDIMINFLGYQTEYGNSICHMLLPNKPKFHDTFKQQVTDYRGEEFYVETGRSISLEETTKIIGDLNAYVNRENVDYLEKLGKYTKREYTMIMADDDHVRIYDGLGNILAEAERRRKKDNG